MDMLEQPLPTASGQLPSFFDELLAALGWRGDIASSSQTLEHLEAQFACSFPGDLRKLIDLTDELGPREASGLAGNRVVADDALRCGAWGPACFVPRGENLFEGVLAHDQKYLWPIGLFQHLSSAVRIGYVDSDEIFAHLDAPGSGLTVLHWEHDDYWSPPRACADSLPAYFLLQYLHEHHDEDSEETLDPAVCRLLDGRVDPGRTERFSEENTSEPLYAIRPLGRMVEVERSVARGVWLAMLLASPEVCPMEEDFYQNVALYQHEAHDPAELDDKTLSSVPANVLYWLWRSFLFDEETVLPRALSVAGEHPSGIVRHAGLVVGDLARGRTDLGTIEDISSVKGIHIEAYHRATGRRKPGRG